MALTDPTSQAALDAMRSKDVRSILSALADDLSTKNAKPMQRRAERVALGMPMDAQDDEAIATFWFARALRATVHKHADAVVGLA